MENFIKFEKQFTDDIKLVSSFLSRKGTTPIIRLQSDGSKLIAYGMDSVNYVMATLPNQVSGVFDITLDRQHFVNIMECAGKDGKINILKDSIEVQGDTIHSMPYSSGEDFIEPDTVNNSFEVTLNDNQLIEMARVVFACSNDRNDMKGICLDNNCVVATDGFRLAKSEFTHKLSKIVLTKEFVNSIAGFKYITLTFDNETEKVKAKSDNFEIISSFTKQFPAYASIIADKLPNSFTANRKDFLNTVKSVMNSSEQVNKKVMLEIKGNTLEITASNPETRYISKAAISITADGDFLTAVNGDYLLDMLNSSKDEKVMLHYLPNEKIDNKTPAHNKALVLNSQKYLSLLMPVSLTDKKPKAKKEKKETTEKVEDKKADEVSKDIELKTTNKTEVTAEKKEPAELPTA